MQSAVDPACIFLITAGSLCAISSNPQVSVIGNQGNQPIPKAINPSKLPSDTDVLSGIRYLCTALIISYLPGPIWSFQYSAIKKRLSHTVRRYPVNNSSDRSSISLSEKTMRFGNMFINKPDVLFCAVHRPQLSIVCGKTVL